MSEQKEKWEEDFDEKSKTSYANGGFLTIDYGDRWKLDTECVKAFIRQALYEAVKEERERIYKKIDELDSLYINNEKNQNWMIPGGRWMLERNEVLSIINEE